MSSPVSNRSTASITRAKSSRGGFVCQSVHGPIYLVLAACIITGAAAKSTGLLIDEGKISFFDAADICGATVGEATDRLEDRFGSDVDVATIGPAGEHLVRFANIVSNRTHQAQRMGMGAVMGSKMDRTVHVGAITASTIVRMVHTLYPGPILGKINRNILVVYATLLTSIKIEMKV